MTRGHAPPSTLTTDDILALSNVRRDIWTNGLYGFFGGGATGYLLHRGAVLARDRKLISSTVALSRNTAFASVMLGAAFGSFLLSTTAGKNSVHTLHPVFERGSQPLAVPKDDDDIVDDAKERSYKGALAKARERADDARYQERKQILRKKSAYEAQFGDGDEDPDAKVNRLELERNRIMRRATLSRNLKEGQGLSDSHGGQWVENRFQNRLDLERNRIMRRASLSKNFKEGQGLSDSHGGHWVEDKFQKE